MERGNSKHGSELDEEMAQEVQSELRGAPTGSRVEEWREPEPAGDDQPVPDRVPDGGRRGAAPGALTLDEAEARSRLAQAVPYTVLPTDRDGVLRGADQLHAPGDVRAQLERLPTGRTFHTVSEIWEALGYHTER